MARASEGAEYKAGDTVEVLTGEAKGKRGKVQKIVPSLATARGKESRYVYLTDASPEFYRSQDLKRA